MSFTPVIQFDYLHFRHEFDMPASHFYKGMEQLRLKVKKATGYTWDNTNFQVTDLFGKPALTIAFYQNTIGIWNFVDGGHIGDYQNMPDIAFLVKQVEEGKGFCCECETWHPRKELIPYSFAGKVCKKCYDPKKHLPPDTRGD